MFLHPSIRRVSSRRGVLDGPGPRHPVWLHQAGVHDHPQRRREQPREGSGPEPALRDRPRGPGRGLDHWVRPPRRTAPGPETTRAGAKCIRVRVAAEAVPS